MGRKGGTKGYRSYRGPGTGRKILIGLLIVILLAALGFLAAQRYVVFDNDGSYRFDFPWAQEKPQKEKKQIGKKKNDVEIVVEEPQVQELSDIHAVELDETVLQGDWEAALEKVGDSANAVAVRVKKSSGEILYDSKISDAVDCGAAVGSGVARTAMEGINASDYYTIAHIDALHDSIFSRAHMTDAAVCQLTGFVWYDTNSTHWLAPEKEAARKYVCDIAKECAELGFDELLFDDFAYPRDGRMSRIKTDERTLTQQAALALLADELRAAVKDSGTKLSVVIDEDIVLAGSEERTGIVMSELAPKFDRVYVKTTAEKLPEVQKAMEGIDTELVPILDVALPQGSYLIGK